MPHATSTDGTRLFYKDLGEGPVVLLLHAWALNSGMWEYQVHPLLDAGYRIIAPDRRGHGRSDYAATGFDFGTLIGDIAVVLDHAGVTEHTIVAHSTGGMEAVHLAARQGGVRAMVLLAPIGPYLENEFGSDPLEATLLAIRADRPQYFRAQADAYFARPHSGISDAMVDDTVATILQTPLEVATALMASAWSTDVRADVSTLDMPILILHGDSDASASLQHTGSRYAHLAPTAQLSVYPGAPHGLYVTEAAQVNAEMIAFLRQHHDPTSHPDRRSRSSANPVTSPAVTGGDAYNTRVVVEELLRRIAGGDSAEIAQLFAETVDWKLDWPDDEHAALVPWIRHRSTRSDIEDHYQTIIENHVPDGATAEIENILVDGPNAVVVGELGQTLRGTGVSYRAGFALYLTVSDGRIIRHHIFEDSLAVKRAFQGVGTTE